MTRPDPYVPRSASDILRAGDWNELQIQAREEIHSHTHSGGPDGTRITGAGIDPSADARVHSLSAWGALRIDGGTADVLDDASAWLVSVTLRADGSQILTLGKHGGDPTLPSLALDGQGRVGIGTDTPATRLDVAGLVRTRDNPTHDARAGGVLLSEDRDDYYHSALHSVTDATDGLYQSRFSLARPAVSQPAEHSRLSVGWYSDDSLATWNHLVTIDAATGHVGIGTKNPASPLHVMHDDSEIKPTLFLGDFFTIDGTQGGGLTNLVAGARIAADAAGNHEYQYINTRGAARIHMDDDHIHFFVGNDTSRAAGQPVNWLHAMSIRTNGDVKVHTRLFVENTQIT